MKSCRYLLISFLLLGNFGTSIASVYAEEKDNSQASNIEETKDYSYILKKNINLEKIRTFEENIVAINKEEDTASSEENTVTANKEEDTISSEENTVTANKEEDTTSSEENTEYFTEDSKQMEVSDSYNKSPRYSVGQTVDLMDQKTRTRWNITIEKDFYQVNQYLGGNTDVVIPSEMSIVLTGTSITKKPVRLNGGSTKFMRNANGMPITSFKVDGEILVNGVEGINNFFKNSNIEHVDLTGLNLNVIPSINFSDMFQGCSNLKDVKFKSDNFKNVVNTSRMFSGCTSLKAIDLSMWTTNKSSIDMSNMFENTPNLRKIDLRNLPLDNQNTLHILGTKGTNEAAVNQPLAIIVNSVTSSRFLNFDFVAESGRVPEAFPILDANGGSFASGESRLKYINKICVTPEQLELSTFNSWKEKNTPNKDGKVFLRWDPSKNEGTPSSVFDLLNITYLAQYKENIDWNYQENKDDVLLTEYIGSSTNIVVPNEVNGKPTKIDLSSAFPLVNLGGNNPWTSVLSVKFSNQNGKKVKAIGDRVWFKSWTSMKYFDGSGLDVSSVRYMDLAFSDCHSLLDINLSGWDTSNVENMNKMFEYCWSLPKLDISNFDTSKVKDMNRMFYNCSGLDTIQLSNFDTKKVTDMSYMFGDCFNLKYLDLRSFEISENVNLQNMFYTNENQPLVVIAKDLRLQDTNYNYKSDNRIPLLYPKLDANGGKIDNQSEVPYITKVCFDDASTFNLDTFNSWKDQQIPIKEGYRFIGWKPSKDVENINSFSDLLDVTYLAQYKENIDWDYQENKDDVLLTEYLGSNTDIVVPNEVNGKPTKIDLSSAFPIKNLGESEPWRKVTSVRFANDNGKKVKAIGSRIKFASWTSLTTFDGSGLDTSSIESLEGLFYDCISLRSIDLEDWDTSQVNSMENAFRDCFTLESFDSIKNWNVEKVSNFKRMFFNCRNIETLDLSLWNPKNVTTTNRMFNGTSNLRIIRLDKFTTTADTDKSYMFNGPIRNMLIITQDQNLLNYTYENDQVFPIGPTFDANGGMFDDGSNSCKYFTSPAVEPNDAKLQETTFKQFMKTLQPTYKNYTFEKWNKESEGLFGFDDIYKAAWLPERANSTIDATVNNVGLLGIAYQPTEFAIPATKLQEVGEQTIPIKANEGFHVGVKDYTNSAQSWTLYARLEWLGKKIPGATIKTTNKSGNVMKNINNGITSFDSKKDLKSTNGEVVGRGTISINETDTPIMSSTKEMVHEKGIYDYDLGKVSLEIPNVEHVPANNYSGSVVWQLAKVPEGEYPRQSR